VSSREVTKAFLILARPLRDKSGPETRGVVRSRTQSQAKREFTAKNPDLFVTAVRALKG